MQSVGAVRREARGDAHVAIVGLVVGAVVAVVALLMHGWPGVGGPVRLVSPSSAAGWSAPVGGWQESVVRVRTARCGDEISGTGVVVDGAVLTNVHVIDGAADVVVTTHDGVDHRVRSMAVSSRIDVAVLEADGVGAGLMLAGADPSVGRPVESDLAMAGFPNGGAFSERTVSVPSTLRGSAFPDPTRAFHLDADVVPGESGSPIVDGRGRLVALLYARALTDGRGLAIGADDLRTERSVVTDRSLESC